jgi:hypothetical protein
MLWAATVYGAGIVIGYYVWRPPLCWLMAAITFSASRAYFLRRRSQSGLCPCSSSALCDGSTDHASAGSRESEQRLAFADGRDVVVTAHVTKEGNLRDHGRGDSQQRLDLETEQINTSSENLQSASEFA